MNKYLSQNLSGYRKVFSTQTALNMLPEKWKKVMDDIEYAGAALMDLSKAFDTINHELLKLNFMPMVSVKKPWHWLLASYLIGGNMLK